MMRTLLTVAAALLALYLGYLALLYLGQRSMMYPGAGMRVGAEAQLLPPGAEPVAIAAPFGEVRAIFLPAAAPGRAPALLYFHGNAEFAFQNVALLQPLAARGVHVLIVEYPGYAGSDGVPGRATLAEAARRSHDWLARRPEVDPARIIAMGRSIGSGPAVELAAERPLAALVLLSAFASIDDFARGMGAPALLIRDRYDNRARLRAYPRPVLLFHGRNDDIIPFAHAQALAGAAPHAQLVALDCGHNDCPYFGAAFFDTLAEFLSAAGILPQRRPPAATAP